MPFYSTLAGTDAHVDLVLAVRVEGIPIAFVERTIPAAVATSLSGYTQFVGITRIEEGEAVLDLEERREKAASLEFDLLDDSSRTLAALFAINRQRVAYITTDAASSATTLSVNTTTPFSAGSIIYTDQETFSIGGTGVGTLTSVARGVYGATAAAVYGAATDGDSLYLAPPNWLGRRAYLYGYTLNANGGGDEQLLGTWIVDSSPMCSGDNAWSMTLASVAQEFYERAIGFNLSEAVVNSAAVVEVSGVNFVDLTVDNASSFRLASNFPTYALVSWDSDVAAIYELTAVDSVTNVIRIKTTPEFGTLASMDVIERRRIAGTYDVVTQGTDWTNARKVRPFQVIGGPSPMAIAYLLISKEGQGATTYDRLPGRLSTSSLNPGWNFGAGFKATEIETTAWAEIETAPMCSIIIDEERKVSDVLREWCYLSGTATRVTVDGKLAPFTLAAPRMTSTTTLSTNDVIPDSRIEITADEGAISALATVRIDYSPLSKEYRGQINMCDVTASKRYGRAPRRREFEFRSFGCSDTAKLVTGAAPWTHPSNLSASEVPPIVADILRSESGKARLLLRLSLSLARLDLRIGDVVTLSGLPDAFSTLPNLQGGTLEGARGRVVARRPRYNDGRVDVQIQIMDPLLHISTASVINSAVGAVLTLSTTGIEARTASPGDDYYIGCGVRLHDVSARVSELRTVTAQSTTTITLDSAPSFAVSGGFDYVTIDPDFSSNGTTVSGYSLQEMATLADDSGLAGGPLLFARWC